MSIGLVAVGDKEALFLGLAVSFGGKFIRSCHFSIILLLRKVTSCFVLIVVVRSNDYIHIKPFFWVNYSYLALFEGFCSVLCSCFGAKIVPSLVVLVDADGKKISTGTIVAIVVVPVVLLALGYALWERRETFKAFTTDSEFPYVLVRR